MTQSELLSTPTPDTQDESFVSSSHHEVIETVIGSMAQANSAMVLEDAQGQLWKFQYGSVEVFVQLTGETDEDLFTAWATVLTLPVEDELGLFKTILTMNSSQTLETRFALMNDQLVVMQQRTVADLSPGEISRAITLVAAIADDNDEDLKARFGGH